MWTRRHETFLITVLGFLIVKASTLNITCCHEAFSNHSISCCLSQALSNCSRVWAIKERVVVDEDGDIDHRNVAYAEAQRVILSIQNYSSVSCQIDCSENGIFTLSKKVYCTDPCKSSAPDEIPDEIFSRSVHPALIIVAVLVIIIIIIIGIFIGLMKLARRCGWTAAATQATPTNTTVTTNTPPVEEEFILITETDKI